MLAIPSAHAGVANPGLQVGEPKKAVSTCAFLNALNEYKAMEGATDQHVDTEPEDNFEKRDNMDAGDSDEQVDDGEFYLSPNDDLEGEQVDEWDND